MLGVFGSSVVEPPEELVAAGARTPSPKTKASQLVAKFLESYSPAVSIRIGCDEGVLAYSNTNQSVFNPRSFAAKDEIFCLFEGALENLGNLRQYYGLSKNVNEVMLVIEAYKALRDRAPYPPSQMLSLLVGNFSFVLFDRSTSALFVASDLEGKVPLYWGITSDGCTAFANDVDLLKAACGKSLATFPKGCFFCTSLGGLKSFENPSNRITAIPAEEEEIWGATFEVEGGAVYATTR